MTCARARLRYAQVLYAVADGVGGGRGSVAVVRGRDELGVRVVHRPCDELLVWSGCDVVELRLHRTQLLLLDYGLLLLLYDVRLLRNGVLLHGKRLLNVLRMRYRTHLLLLEQVSVEQLRLRGCRERSRKSHLLRTYQSWSLCGLWRIVRNLTETVGRGDRCVCLVVVVA